MTSFYVIAVQPARVGTKSYSEGEVAGKHHDYIGASMACWKLETKAERGFSGAKFGYLESERKLKKGDVCEELVKEWRVADAERECLSLMCDVIKAERQGNTDEIKHMAIRLARLGVTLEQLRERYETAALAELERQEAQLQDAAAVKARASAAKVDIAQSRAEMTYSFPAARGIQAGREYYVAQVPYGSLVKLFRFDEEEVVPAECRAQRLLNPRRAEEVGEYVLDNPDDYVLPALTANVSAEMSFEPVATPGASDRLGMLYIPMTATMLIIDGQHRRRGIELAIDQRPSLRSETVAVTIYYDRGLARAQQMFADINGRQVKPSSAISALYDQRNPFNSWVLALLDRMPEIKRRIDFENSSVGARSTKLWSLVGFKKFVTNLTGISERNIDQYDAAKRDGITLLVERFLEECKQHIPEWAGMLAGRVAASEVREQWVIGHAVWLEALGQFGHRLMAKYSGVETVPWDLMAYLNQVDPLKTSKMWEGRCVHLGKMQKTTDGVKSTASQLIRIAGMSLGADRSDLERKIAAAAGR